jgi:pyruvate/2-oxoacid:ferredoxin oxidoreductase beta subunit
MSLKNKRKNAPDSSKEDQHPRDEGNEYEQGREEALEEAEERRIFEEKESVEEGIREHEVRGAHAHTPYFEYDNPSYEDKDMFKGAPSSESKIKVLEKKFAELEERIKKLEKHRHTPETGQVTAPPS